MNGPRVTRVLVVDDDEHLLNIMRDVLNDAGCETATARDGQLAIDRLSAGLLPEVLILDLRMPRVGGIEVVNWLQQHKVRIPIVLATHDDDIRPADVGAVVKLVKPFTLDQLLDAVAIALKAAVTWAD
jgi:CheY-like chemotaxis protein